MTSKFYSLVQRTLEEDHASEDTTTQKLVDAYGAGTQTAFTILAKNAGTYCGEKWLEAFVELKHFQVQEQFADGQTFQKGDILVSGKGSFASVFSVERSLLNGLQLSCQVASLTQQCLKTAKDAAKELGIVCPKILHTRKTFPLLRELQLEAVLKCGGSLHRKDLRSRIMWKDNHKELALSFGDDLKSFLTQYLNKNEKQDALIEVDTWEEAYQVLEADCLCLLLDNFSPDDLSKNLSKLKNQFPQSEVEVSGGITPNNIKDYVLSGVDRISLGALTHTLTTLDLSLEWKAINESF